MKNLPANFRPLHEYVLVVRDPKKTSSSGIIIPGIAQENCQEATVVAVGTGYVDYETGKVSPLEVKKGDRVLVTKTSFDEIEAGGPQYAILREHDIHGILES